MKIELDNVTPEEVHALVFMVGYGIGSQPDASRKRMGELAIELAHRMFMAAHGERPTRFVNNYPAPTLNTCPVCGFGMEAPPKDWHICPCCGTEFELDDAYHTHEQLRTEWIKEIGRAHV